MTTSTQTRTTSSPVSTPAATVAPARAGRWTAFIEAIRARRAQRSELSRQIGAYPATRGAGVTVLPSSQGTAAPSSRFWV